MRGPAGQLPGSDERLTVLANVCIFCLLHARVSSVGACLDLCLLGLCEMS